MWFSAPLGDSLCYHCFDNSLLRSLLGWYRLNQRKEVVIHHSEGWTRARLGDYIGTSETLTLEFKSMRSLIADDKKDKNAKIQEAAKDVAGMANEQGGVIVYGIEESKDKEMRRAERIEEGFTASDKVSREWFLQFVRDRVHPPLPDIDAVEVWLDDEHKRFALIILVPQARGVARQTDDLLFWRRDGQGLRPMSVQEIEDIRLRAVRPDLVLSIPVQAYISSSSGSRRPHRMECRVQISNHSQATATFAVITVGFVRETTLFSPIVNDWQKLEMSNGWKIFRTVISTGSSRFWSPMTPGFTLLGPGLLIETPQYESDYIFRPRVLGYARLDFDGGSKPYALLLKPSSSSSDWRISLDPYSEALSPMQEFHLEAPEILGLPLT